MNRRVSRSQLAVRERARVAADAALRAAEREVHEPHFHVIHIASAAHSPSVTAAS